MENAETVQDEAQAPIESPEAGAVSEQGPVEDKADAPIVSHQKKMYTGRVVSDKMDKTIVVAISKRRMDRLYKKYVIETKRLKAHDENNDAHEGDTVRVIESRPVSKEKKWRLVEILERAK
ncbi:MAG: 30S ribosomal protein S17 [Spirochaetaceae bacterium]|nr:MAG: 30S ribosomal protein S17 [Spirochaetaceae bacterium]